MRINFLGFPRKVLLTVSVGEGIGACSSPGGLGEGAFGRPPLGDLGRMTHWKGFVV